MNDRERILAVLNYEDYDRLPIVHFGFLRATLENESDASEVAE